MQYELGDVVEEGGRVVGQVGKVEQRRRLDAYKGRRQLVKEALQSGFFVFNLCSEGEGEQSENVHKTSQASQCRSMGWSDG